MTIVTLLLAYLSWKYIEKPFRDRTRFNRTNILLFSSVLTGFFISVGLLVNNNLGYPHRWKNSTDQTREEMAKIDNGWCFYSIDTIKNITYGENGLACFIGDKTSIVKGVLFGDSYAGQYEPFWNKVSLEVKININSITTNWCYPSLNENFTGPKSSPAFQQCLYNRKYIVENISKYQFVIIGGNWGDLVSKGKMNDVLNFLDYIAPKVKTIIIMASPKQFDENVMEIANKKLNFGYEFSLSKLKSHKDKNAFEGNEILSNISKKYVNVMFIDRNAIFNSFGKPSDLTTDSLPFSMDGGHISIYGAKSAAAEFLLSKKYVEIKNILYENKN